MVNRRQKGKAEKPFRCSEGAGRKPCDGLDSATKATARREAPFPETTRLLEAVVERGNMRKAYARIVGNKGAAGVDKMPVAALKTCLKERWAEIKEQLLAGTYQPQPVRGVAIPKPGGRGVRKLGIPTVLDRLIQQALHQVLAPLFDPGFSEASYGFRAGRGAHQAVQQARRYVAEGRNWVVDIDLEKFFDRVNHDVLMARVARRVKDQRLLGLIRRYLQAGMMEGGLETVRTEGTPQGGPLSPLLSNILLDDLDKELEKRGHKFCRYADDCNIYVQSRISGERVKASITSYLKQRLRLTVNEQKSAVARPSQRKFLGYSLTIERKPRLRVAPESVARLKGKVRELVRRGRGRNMGRTIQEDLTPLLRGWINYFRLAEVKQVFEELDSWIRRKLRCILWRQWKRPFARAKRLMKRGLAEKRAWASATNGRGPWWNSKASHMNAAYPMKFFATCGLVSLLGEIRRFQVGSQTAGYGTVRPVV